jgi:signal recognition particle receptor subunit beta
VPHVNYEAKEIVFKIVYYGPGLSGKTTNLKYVHGALERENRGEMIVIDTHEERTLFFDFFPLDLGTAEGYRLKFNMYTVPGQVYYEASRRLILEGVDGIVFVADSRTSRLDENIESFLGLRTNLAEFGIDWTDFPIVLQYNKRDLPDLLPLGTLEKQLDLNGIPILEAVATEGKGVLETIKIASRRVIEKFQL